MPSYVNGSMVTDGLLSLLEGVFGADRVGDAEAPANRDLEVGYIVVHRIPNGGLYTGSETAGTESALEWCRYQLMGCGFQRDHAEELSETAAGTVVDRGVSGAFTNALTVVDHQVINRRRRGGAPPDKLGSATSVAIVELLVSVSV